MKILLANRTLHSRGGTESYLETIAPELRQLGHEVHLFTARLGAELEQGFRSAGVPVHGAVGSLDDDYDVAHSQHASVSLLVRARFPRLPLVFASHSRALDIDDPPPLARPGALLAFNERVASRLRATALAQHTPVHRLRQPVTLSVNEPGRVFVADHPRRALAVGRRISLQRDRLERACKGSGLTLDVIARGTESNHVREEIMRADVVFASGRSLLEAMALGRASFLFDEDGAWDWVTPETYPAMESLGFVAGPEQKPLDIGQLVEAIRRYDPDLGRAGHELVARKHSARAHAAQLVQIYQETLRRDELDQPTSAQLFAELGRVTELLNEASATLRAAQWQASEFHGRWHEAEARESAAREQAQAAVGAPPNVQGMQNGGSWSLGSYLRGIAAGRRTKQAP